MPYKFGEYVSTYVDPQSVKISEALRDRFVQSFNAADAVGEELNKLKAADFESDQKLKAELDTKVRENLSRYAQSGDYENMTFDVAATAREYRDRSAPITENYNRYAEYQQKLAKDYEKGRISSSAYRNAIPMTKALGYSGLSIDPNTGMVDPKSYFSGMNIAKDPKITDRLVKVLGQIEADSSEKSITGLYVGENGEMKYTSKQGWEGITEEKVARAYEAVMADPEVQNYLAQEGRFKAFESYSNPDGTLNADALNQVTASGIQMHKAEMDKLSALIGNPKTSQAKKQEYQATLNAYQQSMTYLSGLKDPAQQLNYAASLAKEELLTPYKAIAAGKVYNKTKSDYSEDYSEMEKEKRRAAIARQADIEKLQLEALSKVKIESGGIDEAIISSNVETEKYKIEANIKNDLEILNDSTAGEDEIKDAKGRLAYNYAQLALASKLQNDNAESHVSEAIMSVYQEKPEVGDIDNWGFGTYGKNFDLVYDAYKAWRGGSGNEKDFYNILKAGPKDAEYQGLVQRLNSIYSGEDGNQMLADSKGIIDAKIQALGGSSVKVKRELTVSTVPIGTDPIIANKTAAEIRNQFTTLGDLSGISGLIFRPGESGEEANQTVGTLGGEGGVLESWKSDGFTPESKITKINYGTANGMEFTDKSQTGQYMILTVSPKAEGDNAVVKRPYKEIYIPIEKAISQDMVTELNRPIVKLQRFIQTAGMGTNYKSNTQSYQFEKDFTDEEERAIMFSNELKSKSSTEAAKFLQQNAETFEQYVAMGYLTKDGSFAGMPYQALVIDIIDAEPNKSAKAQISLIDVNGTVKPMTDPSTGNPSGYMDINGEKFRAIVNDQNVGLFDANGYILKTIK